MLNNLFHGPGTLKYKEGIQYHGIFNKGQMHKYGSMIDPEGKFINGQ